MIARRATVRIDGRSRRVVRTVALGLMAVGLGAFEAVGQPANDRTFGDETSVVAVDVLVGARPSSRWLHLEPRLPAAFDPQRLVVRVDGVERPLVGAETLREGRPVDPDPWRLVVALDTSTSRRHAVRTGAALLAERAADLVALGAVEVVALDPSPRRLLAPSVDPVTVTDVLNRLALSAETADAVSERRLSFREAVAAGRVTAFGAAAAADAEVDDARRVHDALLAYLEGLEVTTSRRAVLWVGPGLSSSPRDDYAARLEDPVARELAALDPPALDPGYELDSVARALAGAGWIAYPLHPASPDPLRGRAGGVRIGKVRISGTGAAYEAERRPERAEAELELAAARRDGGDLQGAVASYRRALHHFYFDPRTAPRQIAAWRGLAEVLESLGRNREARDARLAAGELQARIEAEGASSERSAPRAAVARPDDPRAASRERVARATGGTTVEDAESLGRALVDLALRVRVTYQLDGVLETPRPLEITLVEGEESDLELRAPRWTRGGSARVD